MAVTLLVFAFMAGIGQLFRLALSDRSSRGASGPRRSSHGPWLVLYLIITVRLASVLGIGS